jgi:excisionase family DNA binding protein
MSAQVSAAHAARLYGRSEKTVRRWIASGRLPAEKIGGAYSVDLADLAQLVGALSAPTSAQGPDTVSAPGADPDVRTDVDDVHPAARSSALAQADALALLIQSTLTPIVAPLVAEIAASRQTIERQAETIRQQAERLGLQRAELVIQRSELTSLRDEIESLTAPEAPKSTLDASTGAQSAGPATESRMSRFRPLVPWLLALLTIVAVIVLLAR